MKSNIKFFVGLFFLLLSYLFWDLRSETKKTERQTQELKVIDLKQDQIDQITLTNANGATKLERTVDGWMVKEPVADQADSNFVEDFLQASFGETAKEVIEPTEGKELDLRRYKLDAPAGTIQFHSTAGVTVQVQVSELKNFEKNVFARLDSNSKILILPGTWLGRATRKPEDFLDKRIYRSRISGIKQVDVKIKGMSQVLGMKDSRWSWVSHEKIKLDQNRVREFLTMLNETRFSKMEVLPKNLKTIRSIDLVLTSDKKVWKAWLAQGQDKLFYARVMDPEYPNGFSGKVDPGNMEKFLAFDPSEFRDRNEAFTFDKVKLAKIQIQNSLKHFELVLKKDTWEINPYEPAVTVNQKAVTNMIDKLRSAQVVEFNLPKQKDLKLENSIRLIDSAGAEILSLQWGEKYVLNKRELIPFQSSAFSEKFAMDESSLSLWGLTKLIEHKENSPKK